MSKKGLPGTPLSLVQWVETNPLDWIKNDLPRRLEFMKEMRPDMSEDERAYIKKAEKYRNLAISSMDAGSMEASVWAAMNALQMAWFVEISLGAKPLIEMTIASHKQREGAGEKSTAVRSNMADKKKALALEIHGELPEHVKRQSHKAIAEKIIERASKKTGKIAKKLSEMDFKQVQKYVFQNPPESETDSD